MRDAGFVRLGESIGNLGCYRDRLVKWNRARGKHLTHCLTLDVFHGDVMFPIRIAEFVNRDDVRVIEPGSGTGFLFETQDGVWLGMTVRGDGLDGHFATEARVAGAINLSHPAGAKPLKNLVRAEAMARRQGRRICRW